MKKIAIVIAGLAAPGGAEKVAVDLAEEFHQRSHEVTVINFARLPPDIHCHKVSAKTIHVDVPEQPGGLFVQLGVLMRRAWAFRRIFRRERFDHIFSFLEAANVPCALASPEAVLSVHLDPGTMSRGEWLAFRWLYPRARGVIAVSRQMQELLEQRAHLKNVNCIYNPVNTRLIYQKAAESIALQDPFIVAVGRLEHQKRFDLLLEAFARTHARNTCRLLIIGRGSQQEYLEAQIHELGLEQQVVLVGFENNPYKYMARAAFQVMTSDYEGYPLVLIEALSLGCPILSTDCPTGPREIIRHGYNGLLVEKGNVAAIAAGIDTLWDDRGLRMQLSQQARSSVAVNDISKVADAWLAV